MHTTDHIKHITCIIASVIAGFIAMQLTYALLAWALWAWLAMVIALIVSFGASLAAGYYMQTSGYDVAVNVTAKSISLIKGLFA